jgi:hypothetical protein
MEKQKIQAGININKLISTTKNADEAKESKN